MENNISRAVAQPVPVPAALQSWPQFVTWSLEHRPGEPKPRKVPYNPRTGQRADPTDPTTWADYLTARGALSSGAYAGIGFVFTPDDPFVFVDLDDCRDPTTGEWNEEAQQVCGLFPGAAMEISQSGTGCHIVGTVTDKTRFDDRRNKWGGRFECYRADRFMAIGPHGWHGDADTDITAPLDLWLPVRAVDESGNEMPVERDPRWCGPDDDDELVSRMLDAGTLTDEQTVRICADPTSPFNFPAMSRHRRHQLTNALWTGDAVHLSEHYPSNSGQPFDHSAADQSLMNCLAFWTGRDTERMIRLFSRSALGQRDKWTKRAYYRNRTATRARTSAANVYTGNRDDRKRQNERIGEAIGYDVHTGLMSQADMVDHLWFIGSGSGGGAVANAKSGRCSSIAIARNEYAASLEQITYTDGRSGAEKTKLVPALDLWLKDVGRKRADAITWKPGGAIVCDVPEQPGATGFNTWRGLVRPRWADELLADASTREAWLPAWHDHLRYLIPDASERQMFEQWCAHILQHPGTLPQTGWCFIAANTGIGRNWLGSVLVRVLRGHVLANAILDGVLAGNFNGRMSRKLLIVVDEARAGMRGGAAWQHAEKLKTVTNPELREINEKHGLQRAEHNAMRWLVFSNHWDALPIEPDDRRWNIVANPTMRQSAEYYVRLYDLLHRDEFIAAVWAHLSTLRLDGFKPGDLSIQNDARRRMLESLATDVELTVQEFRDTWTAPAARFSDIEGFVNHRHPVNRPNRKMLERYIARAGMIYCEHRPQVGLNKVRFVIVKPDILNERDLYAGAAGWLEQAQGAAGKLGF